MSKEITFLIKNKKIKYCFGHPTNYIGFLMYLPFIKRPKEYTIIDNSSQVDFIVSVYGGEVDIEKYKQVHKFFMAGEPGQRYSFTKEQKSSCLAFSYQPHGENSHGCPFLTPWCFPSDCVKNKLVSAIDSGKYQWRIDMINNYIKNNNLIDVCDTYGHGLNKNNVPGGFHSHPNGKQKVMDDYMFTITAENQFGEDFFTDRVLDPILTNTVPVYKGCTNLHEYFPTECFIEFEMKTDLNKELYESKIKYLKVAKEMILMKYNILSYIDIITDDMSLLDKKRPVTIDTK